MREVRNHIATAIIGATVGYLVATWFQPEITEIEPPKVVPKVVVHRDENGRTFCDIYRSDGIKVRTITIYMDYSDDESPAKFNDLAWTEDDFDESGEVTETRWYNPQGAVYMRTQNLGNNAFRTTSYYPSGKRKRMQEVWNTKNHTSTYYSEDGVTVRYVYRYGDNGLPDTCEVKLDRRNVHYQRKFIREDLRYPEDGGFVINQGDEPKPYCQDTYVTPDGIRLWRQTWFEIWPDDKSEPWETLGAVEVFDADGRTPLMLIRIVPGTQKRMNGEFVSLAGEITYQSAVKSGDAKYPDPLVPLQESGSGEILVPRHLLEGFHLYFGPEAEGGR